MRPFFKHFGSKTRLSKKLPPPIYDTIVEPFAGSAAYSVMYGAGKRVILHDTNEDTVLLWDFLINATPAEIMSIPTEPILSGRDIRELALPRPQFLLVQKWLSPCGNSTVHWLAPSTMKIAKRGGASFWGEKKRGQIAAQLPGLSRWSVSLESFEMAPDIEATWAIDPPYQGNSTGFAQYKCQPPDFGKLSDWCVSRRGQVMVHEQHGADWLPFETLDAKHVTNRTTSTAHEVIWTNQPMAQK